MKIYKVVELFAGCGGFSAGFHGSPHRIEVVAANEFDQSAAATYRLNHPKTVMVEGDITDASIRGRLIRAGAGADVVIGGPPCQAWSSAGKRLGWEDPRGRLWLEFLDVVGAVRPRVAVAENVKGMTHKRNAGALDLIEERFAAMGYRSERRVLNSADYDVPQLRERLVWIATRMDGPIIWPTPSRAPEAGVLDAMKTVRASLMSPVVFFMPLYATAGESLAPYADMPDDKDLNHVRTRHAPDMIKKIERTPPGSGVYESYPGSWMRLMADRPAHTVMGNHGIGAVHPFDDRAVTARELAALQSFEDDFVFRGSKSKVFTQIGNAIPPLMARAIADAVAGMLLAEDMKTMDMAELAAWMAGPATLAMGSDLPFRHSTTV
jgi:DNA (cytosine-5)-methyltransferase 1